MFFGAAIRPIPVTIGIAVWTTGFGAAVGRAMRAGAVPGIDMIATRVDRGYVRGQGRRVAALDRNGITSRTMSASI